MTQRETRGSVRLARFVLSLFVLEESDERLPRCLALQGGDGGDGGDEVRPVAVCVITVGFIFLKVAYLILFGLVR